MDNYIQTGNPFSLAVPPASFLAQMAAYDPDLRVFPSLEEGCHRIARKAKVHSAVMAVLKNRPDTKIYWEHGLVPVTSLPAFEPWGIKILMELQERDIQRVGGAHAAANILDAHDERVEQRTKAAETDLADMMAIDMYREMKHATGQRVSLSPTKFQGRQSRPDVPARKAHRPSHWHGSGGAVFAR